MKILGFYIGGHDSNASLVFSDGTIKYYKKERLVQAKHKKADVEWVKELCGQNGFIPDVVCYSDGNRNGLGICPEGTLFAESKVVPGLFNVTTYCIDHHYAHILSAWPCMNGKNADAGISIDGRGDHQIKCSVIEKPFSVREAHYRYISKSRNYCLLFNEIGKLMNLHGGDLDFAGKIMGINAYGKADLSYINECGRFSDEPGKILEQPFRGISISEICKDLNSNLFLDWAASFHKYIGMGIRDIFSKNTYMGERIVYSGGAAQNTVYNEMLGKQFDMIIPPHCYDGGISLGCIQFAASINNVQLHTNEFPFIQEGEDVGYANEKTIVRVAELLANGKIIAWCQGKGEAGPRALGHRSIIMDPSQADGKAILNKRVKKREFWRPFAASIMSDDAETIMGEHRDCPYMLHAIQVDDRMREVLKSVVHVDGTCRFQTVDDTAELHSFYRLLSKFKEYTGIPALLNTSYNIGGKPIIGSSSDAISAFKSMDIDALCIGNRLIVK